MFTKGGMQSDHKSHMAVVQENSKNSIIKNWRISTLEKQKH